MPAIQVSDDFMETLRQIGRIHSQSGTSYARAVLERAVRAHRENGIIGPDPENVLAVAANDLMSPELRPLWDEVKCLHAKIAEYEKDSRDRDKGLANAGTAVEHRLEALEKKDTLTDIAIEERLRSVEDWIEQVMALRGGKS